LSNPIEPVPPQTGPVVEAKVKTSAAAAALAAFVLSLIQQYVFKGAEVPDALAVMVSTIVITVATGAVTFLVGWLTKHTPRWLLEIKGEDLGV
jgi:hypothetical protein